MLTIGLCSQRYTPNYWLYERYVPDTLRSSLQEAQLVGACDNLFSKLFEYDERAERILRAVLPKGLLSKFREPKPPAVIHKQTAISSDRHGVCDDLFPFARKDPNCGCIVALVEH